ncbi:MAG: N-acetylmuramoyl-L-alanine amidase [Candidatus Aminicenantes bacterium]|nr:N-acetylmuramoyl-L-alanine amidase [Candidatus Aminicenantes bacterium]
MRQIRFPWGTALLAVILLAVPLSPGQDSTVEVYNLRHFTHPNFTRIVVDVGTLREYAPMESRDPGSIYVDIFQARLNPIVREEAIPSKCDYINLIRISQKSPGTVRVTADVDFSRIRRYQVYHVFDPFRIVIDIYPQEREAGPSLSPTAEKTPQPPQPAKSGYSMARQLGLGIKTVIIDPGHGGIDPGCLDPSGLKEKDLTLDISLRVKALLKANTKLDVILTRESDIFVPLENRTVVANQKKADLFVSIHVNAFPDKKRRGIESFYLNFSSDPNVNATAARENATTTKTIGQMDKIIRKIVQNSKIIESKELAEQIQLNLVKYLSRQYSDIKNLGTRGGPFWTLIGCEMPSILVEVSHISNAPEAQRLKTEGYRQQVARGIYEGILAYMQSLGKG